MPLHIALSFKYLINSYISTFFFDSLLDLFLKILKGGSRQKKPKKRIEYVSDGDVVPNSSRNTNEGGLESEIQVTNGFSTNMI